MLLDLLLLSLVYLTFAPLAPYAIVTNDAPEVLTSANGNGKEACTKNIVPTTKKTIASKTIVTGPKCEVVNESASKTIVPTTKNIVPLNESLLNVDKSDDYATTAPPNEVASDYLEPHLGDAHTIPLGDKLDGTQDSSKNGDDDILSDPNVPTNNPIRVLSDPLIFVIFEHEQVSPIPPTD